MSDLKSAVAAQFGATAAAYRTSAVHARGADLARLIALAAPQPQEVALDAGCGAGHTAVALAPHVAHVTALDLSEPMLAMAQALAAERGLHNLSFRRGDVEDIPLGDGSVDLVVSRYSAHHWPAPDEALHEVARVLRRHGAGRFVLGDIVGFHTPLVDSHLQAMELLRDPSHVRDYTRAEWRTLLEAAGFVVEHEEGFECPLHFGEWVARMATPPARVAALQSLLGAAPDEVRAALRVAPGERSGDVTSFVLPGAIFVARLGRE